VEVGHNVRKIRNVNQHVERRDDVIPAGLKLLVVEVNEPGRLTSARQPVAR
jgi:hypothetical protein